MQHQANEGYSGRNPVPTIQAFEAEKARQKQEQDELAKQDVKEEDTPPPPPPKDDEAPASGPNKETDAAGNQVGSMEEKQKILDQSRGGQNAIQKAKAAQHGERTVEDPVTGLLVTLKDAAFDDKKDKKGKDWSAAQLDPHSEEAGPSKRPVSEETAFKSQKVSPHPTQPGNILLQTFPEPYDEGLMTGIEVKIRNFFYMALGGLFVAWVLTGGLLPFTRIFLGGGSKTFVDADGQKRSVKTFSWFFWWISLFVFSMIGAGVAVAAGLLEKGLKRNMESVRLHLERQRGKEFSPPTPESVEWLNSIIGTVWPLISPDMFVAVADQIEDIMQASLPKFIESVRIADLGQGRNPLRLVAMRGLPDAHGKRAKKSMGGGEEWITQGKDPKTGKLQENAKDDITKDETGKENQKEEEAGDYINMEISFLYQAVPKKKNAIIQADNMHLLIEFFVGVVGWFNIPIKIWIEVKGLVGTVRLRLQMVEQAPFIRNATITLMGTPAVDVSATPLSRALPNVLDLPLVSGFVHSAIEAACAEYTAPKSITMDLSQMIMGDDVKKDTLAIGVLCITVHYAVDLAAADSNGRSDPYVVLAYAKFGKPLYSTRVMIGDLNPIWEETCYILVTQDEVKSGELVSAQLWDSDAHSADDILGRVEVPLLDCMKETNKMIRRKDKLHGFADSADMPGELHWSMGYYPKVKLNPEMKKQADAVRDETKLPEHLQGDTGEDMKDKPSAVDSEEEAKALDHPPDPAYPSGVVSIIIHQINNLENMNIMGQMGSVAKRAGKPGQPTADDAEIEEQADLPSSYCEICLNDDLVYKTRTKQITSNPFFNAGTERFVRDWRHTTMRVVVRDARLREHDAILGVVTLPLAQVLKTQSQVTRWFSITDGVGFGRVRISLLFKGVSLQLPKQLLGWDTGTVELHSDVVASGVPASFKSHKLIIRTSDAEDKIPSRDAEERDGAVVWAVDEASRKIRLPIYHRYASSVVFSMVSGGPFSKPNAIAVVWLDTLPDDELTEVEVDILHTDKDVQQLEQSYMNEVTKDSHPFEVIGKLKVKLRFDPGLDEDHEHLAKDERAKHSYDDYMAAEGANAQMAEAREGRGEDDEETPREKYLRRKELHRQHRGVMQFKPVRSAVWFGDGLKNKLRQTKNKIAPKLTGKDPGVETEV